MGAEDLIEGMMVDLYRCLNARRSFVPGAKPLSGCQKRSIQPMAGKPGLPNYGVTAPVALTIPASAIDGLTPTQARQHIAAIVLPVLNEVVARNPRTGEYTINRQDLADGNAAFLRWLRRVEERFDLYEDSPHRRCRPRTEPE